MQILISWLLMKPADQDPNCYEKRRGKEYRNIYADSALTSLNTVLEGK